MNTWVPSIKALWMAEHVVGSVHNIYTLRGAQVRDSLVWSKYINEALYKYGTAKVKGNQKVPGQLASTMVTFEIGFEILPGTKGEAQKEGMNDFEASVPTVAE